MHQNYGNIWAKELHADPLRKSTKDSIPLKIFHFLSRIVGFVMLTYRFTKHTGTFCFFFFFLSFSLLSAYRAHLCFFIKSYVMAGPCVAAVWEREQRSSFSLCAAHPETAKNYKPLQSQE